MSDIPEIKRGGIVGDIAGAVSEQFKDIKKAQVDFAKDLILRSKLLPRDVALSLYLAKGEGSQPVLRAADEVLDYHWEAVFLAKEKGDIKDAYRMAEGAAYARLHPDGYQVDVVNTMTRQCLSEVTKIMTGCLENASTKRDMLSYLKEEIKAREELDIPHPKCAAPRRDFFVRWLSDNFGSYNNGYSRDKISDYTAIMFYEHLWMFSVSPKLAALEPAERYQYWGKVLNSAMKPTYDSCRKAINVYIDALNEIERRNAVWAMEHGVRN